MNERKGSRQAKIENPQFLEVSGQYNTIIEWGWGSFINSTEEYFHTEALDGVWQKPAGTNHLCNVTIQLKNKPYTQILI